MQFADSALMLRKSLHTLTGVIRDVSPDTPIDALLWSDAMAAFVGDFATRGIATPNDTGFAVRLSNADLFQSWMSLSLAPLRYWQRAMSRKM